MRDRTRGGSEQRQVGEMFAVPSSSGLLFVTGALRTGHSSSRDLCVLDIRPVETWARYSNST